MEESVRPESLRAEPAPPRDVVAGTGAPAATSALPGPPDLADPRALTILTTEHWGYLTARSLVYNEAFSRGAMFLTFLSASLVALGFVAGSVPGAEVPLVVLAILALDLLVGLATLGRLASSGREEFRALQAMHRLRHAYLEIAPGLAPFLTDTGYDDPGSVLATYGTTVERQTMLANIGHGLTTMVGLVSALDAAIIGGLAATAAVLVGVEARMAVAVGVVVGVAAMVVLALAANAVFERLFGAVEARFPAPGAPPTGSRAAAVGVAQDPGRRNT